MRARAPRSTWGPGPALSGRDRASPTSRAPPWWCAKPPRERALPKTCRWGRTSTSSGGWPRLAGGPAMSRPPRWDTSTGSGCASGWPGARTTGLRRPHSSCAIRARCARFTPRRGPRWPGWPWPWAALTPVPWSPAPAPLCSPAGWLRSPARAGRGRPTRPPGGWRRARRAAGPWRRSGRWAARSPAPGGRWPCPRRWRWAGSGFRWPCWCSRRRCWTGWTGVRRWTRPAMWPPGCSTTSGTASESGRDAPSAGPLVRCCPCCEGVARTAVTYRVSRTRVSRTRGHLCRPRLNSAGTMMSSGDTSWIEDRPSASRVASIPPRSTSKTFCTPEDPLAASPHR